MFNLRYRVLEKYVDYFVVCESIFDHKEKKRKKFYMEKIMIKIK